MDGILTKPLRVCPQPSPHFSYSEINALPLNGQQAVTAINALWLRRSTAFRWLQQPIGRHLMIDVVEQVIERHPKVKNEGIPEGKRLKLLHRRKIPDQLPLRIASWVMGTRVG
jgi:hypothetical protein